MWPAIIGAAESLFGSLFSSSQADKASKRQFGQQKELMRLQDDLNRSQYEWQYNKFLSPSAQREAYENAGFNVNDIGRQGGSMIQSGSLGSVSAGSTSAVMPDTSGITNAGNILAQGAKTASETKLNLQKAITEQKLQYLHTTTADLNVAFKENEVAKTAITNIHRIIAERTKDDKIRMSKLEVESLATNLLILDENLTDLKFKNEYLNPAVYANAQADYIATTFASLVAMTDIKLKQAEYEFVMAQVKTEATKQILNNAAATNQLAQALYHSNNAAKVGQEYLIEKQKADAGYGTSLANLTEQQFKIEKQKVDFNYGQHLAEQTKWAAKQGKRNYRWTGILNGLQAANMAMDIGVKACDMGATFMTGGLSNLAKNLGQSKIELNQAMARKANSNGTLRTIYDKKGRATRYETNEVAW